MDCGIVSDQVCARRKTCRSCHEIGLKNDFIETVSNGSLYLFRKNFTKISKFTAIQHVRFFTRNNLHGVTDWHSMLEHYEKFEDFKNEIIKCYKEWDSSTDDNKGTFTKVYPYIAQEDVSKIGTKKLKELAGLEYDRHTREEYVEEFNRLYSTLGHYPSQKEIDEGRFSVCGFKGCFGVDKKRGFVGGMVYELYGQEEYLLFKDFHKTRHLINRKPYKKKNSDHELMKIFNDFVFKYRDDYDVLPSHRLFEKECRIAIKTYRERFGKTWSEMLMELGFEYDEIYRNNRSEKQCLDKIAKILNYDYTPQKRFSWLIGVNNFPLFCDGYFEKCGLVVEFNGRQHYKFVEGKFGDYDNFKKQQANDNVKRKLIPENGLTLLEIKSSSPWHKEDWLKKKLIECGVKFNHNAQVIE